MVHDSNSSLIAVDIGNSRIKLGRFDPVGVRVLPEPSEVCELPLEDRSGQFNDRSLADWCDAQVPAAAHWIVSSVHRGAADRFESTFKNLSQTAGRRWTLRLLTHRDVPLAIEVDAPEHVGVDRLMAAVAADQLRPPDRAAIVVDLGTAITVDLVTTAGAFAGGAILPGLATSARALEQDTDALPRIAVDGWTEPPEPLGKATVPAIEAGLFWGAVGAIRELVGRLAAVSETPVDVFVSGGGAKLIADVLDHAVEWPVRHVPHLVLAGIALVGPVCAGQAPARRDEG